ncbi:MAG: DNA primase DnaG [Candidatus Woesearchaeota archaeon]
MAKVSIVAAKYIIHADIEIDGVVDKPDVIGAIFGQTEGLMGNDLELRELQRSGRIGRIEVNLETKMGRSKGTITIPSSLDKAETCIVAASLEVIQRIGPCNAKITVTQIEDVRISKRKYIINRAKDLLKDLISAVLPDSQELAEEVANAVRVMEIQEYGKERLPAGPAIDESDEVIVVEGRADVLNLLKHGIKNVIAMNGSGVPQTIIELSKKKEIIAFVDGDRGGILDLKALLMTADIDYVARAPIGKEVEELTKKEIHQALRAKITAEQAKMEYFGNEEWVHKEFETEEEPGTVHVSVQQNQAPNNNQNRDKERDNNKDNNREKRDNKENKSSQNQQQLKETKKIEKTDFKENLAKYRDLLENLLGTKGAYLVDEDNNILAKVPASELNDVLKNIDKKLLAIILDGVIDKSLVTTVEKMGISYVVGVEIKAQTSNPNIKLLSLEDLN